MMIIIITKLFSVIVMKSYHIIQEPKILSHFLVGC